MWFLKKYLCWLLEIIFLMFWSCLVSLLLYHLSFWRLYYLIFPPFFFLSLLWCSCFVSTSGCIILFIQNPKHYLKIFLVTQFIFSLQLHTTCPKILPSTSTKSKKERSLHAVCPAICCTLEGKIHILVYPHTHSFS